jgi:hypothetical protein
MSNGKQPFRSGSTWIRTEFSPGKKDLDPHSASKKNQRPQLGCPRNNQIFFSVRTETNWNSICFGCFSICFTKPKNIFFGLFQFISVFRTGNETTKTNRIFSKQTEKISKKRSLFWGPRFFFLLGSNRNKPKLNLFQCFSIYFFAKKKKNSGLFRFVLMFRTGIKTTETNRTYGMGIKKVDILTNLLLFRFVFCLFRFFFV